MKKLLLVLSFMLLATAGLQAQIGRGEIGFSMAKASGNAGTLCPRTFSCNFLATPLQRGEKVTLTVRGVRGKPFAIAIGLDQSPVCLQLPGIHNKLMFLPAFVPFAGVLSQRDRILACPGGLVQISLTVPLRLQAGVAVVWQALAWSFLAPNQVPTFTVAIRTKLR